MLNGNICEGHSVLAAMNAHVLAMRDCTAQTKLTAVPVVDHEVHGLADVFRARVAAAAGAVAAAACGGEPFPGVRWLGCRARLGHIDCRQTMSSWVSDATAGPRPGLICRCWSDGVIPRHCAWDLSHRHAKSKTQRPRHHSGRCRVKTHQSAEGPAAAPASCRAR